MLTTEPRATQKYLTFFMGGEEYGVSIEKVQEIIRAVPVTPMPNAQPFVLGLINLRGRVIPVADLGRRLGTQPSELGPFACIMVVRARELHTGLMIDRMNEVIEVPAAQIEPTPDFGAGVDREFVHAIAKLENRVVLLLDADALFAGPASLT